MQFDSRDFFVTKVTKPYYSYSFLCHCVYISDFVCGDRNGEAQYAIYLLLMLF